jgi:hypothetical protein
VQATSPDRVLITHLSLRPKDTCRLLAPALQVAPSSAHFEKPEGQSAAEALVENNAASAAHNTVYFGVMWFSDGSGYGPVEQATYVRRAQSHSIARRLIYRFLSPRNDHEID